MSLTSYQTAPPRDLERPIITGFAANANDEFAVVACGQNTCRCDLQRQGIRPLGGRKFQRSSVVERSAVNRLVVGSNPTAGAIYRLTLKPLGHQAPLRPNANRSRYLGFMVNKPIARGFPSSVGLDLPQPTN